MSENYIETNPTNRLATARRIPTSSHRYRYSLRRCTAKTLGAIQPISVKLFSV